MTDSILNSVKKVVSIGPSDTSFDQDLIMLINSALSTLHQLGVGPANGFEIEDASAVWADFLLADVRYNSAKTYVCQKVRLAFDPPPNSFTVDALKQQILELEWRLNVVHEGDVSGFPTTVDDAVLDGGAP